MDAYLEPRGSPCYACAMELVNEWKKVTRLEECCCYLGVTGHGKTDMDGTVLNEEQLFFDFVIQEWYIIQQENAATSFEVQVFEKEIRIIKLLLQTWKYSSPFTSSIESIGTTSSWSADNEKRRESSVRHHAPRCIRNFPDLDSQ
ncbi:10603_t:CDS:2 [Acaulospora morrowiae]|uniref:10603_t:CDS:1 n=1 Tax=Acaulospora morrowiae TaxID=94023 RepID=A0A9N8W6U4_9GLOM|nr:10603_t:CDS:2 [Acaulospora morrowiae]